MKKGRFLNVLCLRYVELVYVGLHNSHVHAGNLIYPKRQEKMQERLRNAAHRASQARTFFDEVNLMITKRGWVNTYLKITCFASRDQGDEVCHPL